MRVLVTGADGFVGSRLVARLRDAGHDVTAAVCPEAVSQQDLDRRTSLDGIDTVGFELRDHDSVCQAVSGGYDAIAHLAGIASGHDAYRDPELAWEVNTVGTARLALELGRRRHQGHDPVLLMVSTAEVYGRGVPQPRVETDPVEPCSPYAASKLAAEVATLEVHRRSGLRCVIARSFPHSGPSQDRRFVIPAFVERMLFAKKIGAPVVKVGNLEPVREFMHVDDVVDAYVALMEHGQAGQVYNVASGRPIQVRDLFFLIADTVGHRAIPEEDHELIRPVDIPHLVGDSSKLAELCGWSPTVPLEQIVAEVVGAQTD